MPSAFCVPTNRREKDGTVTFSARHAYTGRGVILMVVGYYDLREKDVVDVVNGEKLGRICDIDIDLACAQVIALWLPGKARFFGLFGREEDIMIPWKDITLIGEDVILVTRPPLPPGKSAGRKRKY